jgi:uncharacterized protein GlcG (DUF336 family)
MEGMTETSWRDSESQVNTVRVTMMARSRALVEQRTKILAQIAEKEETIAGLKAQWTRQLVMLQEGLVALKAQAKILDNSLSGIRSAAKDLGVEL